MKRSRVSLPVLLAPAALALAAPVPGQVCQESLATWGGADDDFVYLSGADAQSNWFVAGGTLSSGAGGEDVLLLRIAPNGTVAARTWGGNQDDLVESLCVEDSGTLYMAGLTESFGASEDGLIVKYDDATGTFPWARRWDENGNEDELDAVAVYPTTGDVFAAGCTRNPAAIHDDVLLVKYDPAGSLLWAKLWASSAADSENVNDCVVDASDPDPQNHRLYLAGGFESFFQRDALLIQMDTDGNPLWVRTWDRGGCDDAYGMELDGSGFVYVTGATRSADDCDAAGEEVFLTKWDAQGNLIWDVVWSSGEDSGGGISLDPSPAGGIYLSGETFCNGPDVDAFVLKFDPAGQLLWSRAWGGPGNEAFEARYRAGDLYCAGYTDSCCGILRDCAGVVSSPAVVVGAPAGSASNASGSSSPANGVAGSPSDLPGCGAFDALIVKLTDCGPTTRTPFCFGDGNGTPCPCGNSGGPGEGCAHSGGTGSALDASGTNGVGAGDLVLEAASAVPSQPGLFFQGLNAVNAGCGIPFGDGLRCVGNTVVRLEIVVSNGAGDASSTVGVAAIGGVSAGDLRRYQYWYRDPGGGPCGNTFNLTNGLEIVWLP